MKNYFYTILLMLLTAVCTTTAQQPFEIQYPIPHASYIFDVHAYDSLHALAVGNFNKIMETFDGGRSWSYQELNLPENKAGSTFSDVVFTDSLSGWIAGSSFTIMHTADGGASWQQQEIQGAAQLPAGTFEKMHFLDKNTGWAVGYEYQTGIFTHTGGVIVRTQDGGKTWQTIQSFDTIPHLTGVYFSDSLNGWVGGKNGFLMRTRNGGATWQKVMVTNMSSSRTINSITSLSDSITLLSTHNGRIYRTADDGATWTEFKNSGVTTSMATRLHFYDSLRGIGYGVGGFYFTTEDGGASWKKVDLPGEILDEGYLAIFLPALSAPSDGSLWMAGNYGVVFRSNDGGKKWQRMTTFRDNLSGVRSTDELNAWAFGNANTLLHTTDGGKNWLPLLNRDASRNVHDIFFLDNATGWIVESPAKANYKTLRRTSDGGLTWSEVFSDSLYHLGRILFFDNQNGLATKIGKVGGIYTVLKTSNGGAKWKTVYEFANGTYGYEMSFTSRMNGWMACYGGLLLHTTDGGETWKESNVGKVINLSTIHFRDSLNGWTAGDKAARFSTNDGGATWQDRTDSSIYQNSITSIRFTDAQKGVLTNAGLWETSDAGFTWKAVRATPIQIDPNVGIYHLTVTPNGTVWAAGERTLILHRSGSGTSVAEKSNEANPTLIQAHPNPAAGAVHISVADASSGILRLSDTFGRTVATIATEQTGDGVSANLSTANLPSGMYFLRWKSATAQQTIPLVIAR